MEQTLQKSQKTGEPLRVLDMPLSLIDSEGQSVRDATDDDHVVELAMSISRHGLLEPIVVEEKEDGRYQLLAGFHRLAAFHRLRKETIPASIKTEHTGPVKAIALVENICRKDMSLDEQVKAVNHLHTDENLSISSICDLIGKSTSWVHKRLMIPNLPEEVLTELMDGIISISHAEAIGNVQDSSLRRILLNQVVNQKLTARQTEDLAALYLQAPSVSYAIEAGIEKAKEIQAQQKATRRCDIRGEIMSLENITFVAICPACLAEIHDALEAKYIEEGNKCPTPK